MVWAISKTWEFDDGDPVKSLDVSILHNNIISTIFDINDPERWKNRVCWRDKGA